MTLREQVYDFLRAGHQESWYAEMIANHVSQAPAVLKMQLSEVKEPTFKNRRLTFVSGAFKVIYKHDHVRYAVEVKSCS